MGQFHALAAMFRGVTYNKFTTAVVREKMEAKIKALSAKVAERRERVIKLMQEHGITSEMLSDMVIQYMKDQEKGTSRMSYSVTAAPRPTHSAGALGYADVMVPAGAVANIVTEKNLIESEGEEAKRLVLIVRNLRDTLPAVNEETGTLIQRAVVHMLTDEEIEYLGL
jgi:hypothetical protein